MDMPVRHRYMYDKLGVGEAMELPCDSKKDAVSARCAAHMYGGRVGRRYVSTFRDGVLTVWRKS